MDTKALARKFWAQGYLVIEDFFSAKLMDQYQQLILEHFGENPQFLHNEEFLEKSATQVIPWFPEQDGCELFDIAGQDQRLQVLTAEILGGGWRPLYSMVMFSRKGTRGQAWHQDCDSHNPAVFNLNRLIYTEDITDGVGGQTLVIPGSHKRGTISVGPVDETFTDQLVLKPKKGTLILLHGHTWHRVLPVRGKYRVSTNYRCAPKNTPEDITDISVYRNMRYQFSTSQVIENR